MSFPQGQVRGDPLTLTEEIQMGCHFSAHSLPSSPMTLHNQPTMEEGHCLLLSSQLVSPCVSFLYKFRKRVSFTLYFCNLIIWVFKVIYFFLFFWASADKLLCLIKKFWFNTIVYDVFLFFLLMNNMSWDATLMVVNKVALVVARINKNLSK